MTARVNTLWDPNVGDVVNPNFNSMSVVSGLSVTSGGAVISGATVISGSVTVDGQLITSGGIASPAISRPIALTATKTTTGVGITATATGSAVGISRAAGTSMVLLGEVASSGTKVDKALWQIDLPGGYVSAASLPIVINQQVNGTAGGFTGSTTILAVVAYTEVNGAETSVTTTISGSSATSATMTASATDITFVASGGSAFVPGAQVTIEATMTVVNTSGTNTGVINGAKIIA
jgi:hypothetical protein